MSDERGQALVVCVLLLAMAAVAIVGLRDAQERILDLARQQRAGEAAVEAAGAAVADLWVAGALEVSPGDDGRPTRTRETTSDPDAFVRDPRVSAAARQAAAVLARENGGEPPSGVAVSAVPGAIEVRLALAGRAHRATFPTR